MEVGLNPREEGASRAHRALVCVAAAIASGEGAAVAFRDSAVGFSSEIRFVFERHSLGDSRASTAIAYELIAQEQDAGMGSVLPSDYAVRSVASFIARHRASYEAYQADRFKWELADAVWKDQRAISNGALRNCLEGLCEEFLEPLGFSLARSTRYFRSAVSRAGSEPLEIEFERSPRSNVLHATLAFPRLGFAKPMAYPMLFSSGHLKCGEYVAEGLRHYFEGFHSAYPLLRKLLE